MQTQHVKCRKTYSHPVKLVAVFAVIVGLLASTSSLTTPVVAVAQTLSPTEQETLQKLSATTAQGYTDGLGPFLELKPYRVDYSAPIWLNSFFDHSLPVYAQESQILVPAALRDTNRARLVNFLGETITTGPNGNVQRLGVDSYSGHDGVDYTVPDGRPIIAPAHGIIRVGSEATLGREPNTRPNTCLIWIDHDASRPLNGTNDFSTTYAHLSSIGEAPLEQRNRPGRDSTITTWIAGDIIRKGDVIGNSGNDQCEGTSTGPHLHFGVAQGSTNRSGPRIFDPFGWWSNAADPWTNSQLDTLRGLWRRPTQSLWAWAAPRLPNPGEPNYLGADILAQTDDTDASFQILGPNNRRTRANGWSALLPDATAGIAPVGSGAWLSQSIINETTTLKKNWAIWGLHVPANGQYRIQVHLPTLPSGVQATTNARYTVFAPQEQGVVQWSSQAINQRANNEWRDITNEQGSALVTLRENTVVLVALSDVTGVAGDAVVFDAVRLKSETPPEPPILSATRRVGFAIDNSSSMVAQGKLSAVKSTLPPWVDELTASGARFSYALLPFANNTPPIQQTTDPNRIKQLIGNLSGNDNGVSNAECPEQSLGAVAQLAPAVQGGTMLLFTDDLPLNRISGTFTAINALAASNVKFHAIVLPKTCNFGSGNEPAGWLAYQFLAFATGGTYQSVSTTNTGAALQIVLNEMRAQGQLSVSSSAPIVAAAPADLGAPLAITTYPMLVDSTVTKLNVLLNTQSGTATLNLRRPDGSTVLPSDPGVTLITSESAQYYTIVGPSVGMWEAIVDANGEYRVSSSVESSIQFSYLGDIRGSPGQPLTVAARLAGPVSTASFAVEAVDGQGAMPLSLRDDGAGNDLQAGDGLYTGYLTPTTVGDLRMRVTGTTTAGEHFSRIDSRLIRIQGVRVEGPAPMVLPKGTVQTLTFRVVNLEASTQTYAVNVQSENGWIRQLPPSQLIVNAGATVAVPVVIQIPNDAPGNAAENIWLTVTKTSDTTVIAEDVAQILLPDSEGSGTIEYRVFLPSTGR